jgi:hypothetical protein
MMTCPQCGQHARALSQARLRRDAFLTASLTFASPIRDVFLRHYHALITELTTLQMQHTQSCPTQETACASLL